MPRCFVTGCKSGYDSARSATEKRRFFKPPNDASRLQEWQRAIPRLDKELSSTCVVCDLHFREEDILKDFVHNIGGDVVVIPRDKWALKDDAIPRLFPNCPKYLSKPARKRKAPAVRPPPQLKRRKRQEGGVKENICDYDGGCSTNGSVVLETTTSLFDQLLAMAQEGRRIQGWSMEVIDATVVLYQLEVENSVPRVGKAVVVSSNHSLSVSAYGRLVPSTVYTTNLAIEMKSYNDLKCLLDYIERLKPCEGCPAKLHPRISSS